MRKEGARLHCLCYPIYMNEDRAKGKGAFWLLYTVHLLLYLLNDLYANGFLRVFDFAEI